MGGFHRLARGSLAAAAALAAVLIAARAQAAPGLRLQVQVAASDETVASLRSSLGPMLARRGVALDVVELRAVDVGVILNARAAHAAPDLLATAWLDGRTADAATLILRPRQADRVLARRIELTAGLDAVALTEVAFVIDRAAASLLAAEPVGSSIDEARATLTRVAPPAPTASTAILAQSSRPPTRLVLAVFGGGTLDIEQEAVWQAGASVGAERGYGRAFVGLHLQGQFQGPSSTDTPDAHLTLLRDTLHAIVQAGRMVGARGRISAGAGLGLALTEIQAAGRVPAGATFVDQKRHDASVDLIFQAQGELVLGPHVDLFLRLAAGVGAARPRYTATIDGRSDVVLATPAVRPALLAGAVYRL